jgi:hypothetical protein
MEPEFSPGAIAALEANERVERLHRLEAALARTLGQDASPAQFIDRTREAINELRALGHDLWSFDSDGDTFETWCGDWTRPEMAGPLTITFRAPASVEVGWRAPPHE